MRMNLLAAVCLCVAACTDDAAVSRQPSAAGRQPTTDERQPVVLFFGTNPTAGLGLEPEESYPSLIEARIDSAGLPYPHADAGLIGLVAAAGVRSIDWLLSRSVAVREPELGRH